MRAPKYWWDFDGPNLDVIVQSDWPGGSCLARFSGPEKSSCREQVAQAESLIKDYVSGRKTPNWGHICQKQ